MSFRSVLYNWEQIFPYLQDVSFADPPNFMSSLYFVCCFDNTHYSAYSVFYKVHFFIFHEI